MHPIRVAPDGSVVLLGSGRIYDAVSLLQIDTLSNNITDAVWVGGDLFTLIPGIYGSEIQAWSRTYAILENISVVGEPLRIFSMGANLMIITSVDGIPRFYFMQADAPRVDTDSDLMLDPLDNCILVPNSDQRDSNADGYGNICDPDLNNDLSINAADLAILKSSFFTSDAHADLDGDSVVNSADLAIMKAMFFMPPGPSGLVP
jgi:hypothetical protein